MPIVCAWCNTVLAVGDGAISHGICGTCAKQLLASARGLAGKASAPRRTASRNSAPVAPNRERERSPGVRRALSDSG